MSGIALDSPISRGADPSCDIQFIGINYQAGRVFVRVVYQPSGTTQDVVIGQGGVESISALVNAVSNFAGLRVALLNHLQSIGALPSGGVS